MIIKLFLKILLSFSLLMSSLQSAWADSSTYYLAQTAPIADSTFDLELRTSSTITHSLKEAPYQQKWGDEYNSLTDAEKIMFLQKRESKLLRLSRLLHYSKLAMGTASLVGDKVTQLFNITVQSLIDYKKKRAQDLLINQGFMNEFMRLEQPIEIIAADLEAQSPTPPKTVQTFRERVRERSLQIVNKILKAADQEMWQAQRFTIKKNEMAVYVGFTILSISGFEEKVKGGSFGYGVSFGFNNETMSLIFQAHKTHEKLVYAYIPVTVHGITPKIGLMRSMQVDHHEALEHHGAGYYPPAAPYFDETYTDMYVRGFNGSFLVYPPVMADMATYKTDIDQKTNVRLTVPLPRALISFAEKVSSFCAKMLKSRKN